MFKKIILAFIGGIQKILIVIFLTLIYFLGLGATLLFMLIFNRKPLKAYSKDSATFWGEAKGYESGMEDALRQS
jgi:hypothetical protein